MAKWTAELTMTGIITGTEVVHAIVSTGKSHTVPMVVIDVQKAYVTDLEVTNWELPEKLYLKFEDIVGFRPDIGDRIKLVAEVGAARFANADDAAAIARHQNNQLNLILGRARSFAKRYAGRKKADFDRLTAQYATTEINMDEWLEAQRKLLPNAKLLGRLQQSLTMIDQARRKELDETTRHEMVAEETISMEVEPGGRFPHQTEHLGTHVDGRVWKVSQADIDAEFLRLEAEG